MHGAEFNLLLLINAAIAVHDGPKGSPMTRDAVFMKASDFISPLRAFSSEASDGTLLACGLTEDELKDLEIRKYSSGTLSAHQEVNRKAWH